MVSNWSLSLPDLLVEPSDSQHESLFKAALVLETATGWLSMRLVGSCIPNTCGPRRPEPNNEDAA